jgi:DNA-binding transcriptional ArsR family regulator
MAVSKAFLFSSKGQALSTFGKAIGHPARAEILARLVDRGVLTYSEMIYGLPLKKGTINDHLTKLKGANLIEPVLLANNLVGYKVNRKSYDRCLAEVANYFPSLEKQEEDVFESGWVRDYEAEMLSWS